MYQLTFEFGFIFKIFIFKFSHPSRPNQCCNNNPKKEYPQSKKTSCVIHAKILKKLVSKFFEARIVLSLLIVLLLIASRKGKTFY